MLAAALDWRRDGPPQPLLPGDELAAELGIPEGPELGELIGELRRPSTRVRSARARRRSPMREATRMARDCTARREEGMADPVRLERDGAVAVLVLDDPPLNLFGQGAFEALEARVAEVEESDARALVWRAEGEVFTGGADVNTFVGIDPAQSGEMFAALVGGVRRLEALPIRRSRSSTASA